MIQNRLFSHHFCTIRYTKNPALLDEEFIWRLNENDRMRSNEVIKLYNSHFKYGLWHNSQAWRIFTFQINGIRLKMGEKVYYTHSLVGRWQYYSVYVSANRITFFLKLIFPKPVPVQELTQLILRGTKNSYHQKCYAKTVSKSRQMYNYVNFQTA